MEVSKPLLTDFGIHHRLESCAGQCSKTDVKLLFVECIGFFFYGRPTKLYMTLHVLVTCKARTLNFDFFRYNSSVT